jgi:hypothetical protein
VTTVFQRTVLHADLDRCFACHADVTADIFDDLPSQVETDEGIDTEFLLCDPCAVALGGLAYGPLDTADTAPLP